MNRGFDYFMEGAPQKKYDAHLLPINKKAPKFDGKHIPEIIKIISSKKYLYFENFIKGFDAIYSRSFADIVKDKYEKFITEKRRIKKFRNKILHGQLTGEGLSVDDLRNELYLIPDPLSCLNQ